MVAEGVLENGIIWFMDRNPVLVEGNTSREKKNP
jgi:hypothetical protein